METVICATVDTYICHAAPGQPGVDLDQGQAEIGRLMSKIQEINDLEYDIILNGSSNLKTLTLAAKIQEMREIKDSMPTPAELNALHLTCRDDTFLEVLTGNIKGAILSFQSWVKKVSTLKKALLTKQINTLRSSFLVNAAQI